MPNFIEIGVGSRKFCKKLVDLTRNDPDALPLGELIRRLIGRLQMPLLQMPLLQMPLLQMPLLQMPLLLMLPYHWGS